MKRILSVLLCLPFLFIFCGASQAFMLQGIAGSVSPVAACGVIDSFTETPTGAQNIAKDAGYEYIAFPFTGSGATIHKISLLNLKDGGSPTDLEVSICADNGSGNPSTTCEAMDTNICPSTTCTSGTYAQKDVFSAAGVSCANGATCWVRLHHALDASNFFIIGVAAETGTIIKRSADGTTYATAQTNYQANHEVSSCTE
jgi:hypothetical protein